MFASSVNGFCLHNVIRSLFSKKQVFLYRIFISRLAAQSQSQTQKRTVPQSASPVTQPKLSILKLQLKFPMQGFIFGCTEEVNRK